MYIEPELAELFMSSFNKVMIFVSILFIELLVGTEIDLFVPAFPEIQETFKLSTVEVENLLSLNFLGYCVALCFVGALRDNLCRKKSILIGLAIFLVGSILCFGNSYYYLVAGRVLQGIGIAAPSIMAFLIITDLYGMRMQQYLMAVLNVVLNIIVAIGPVVGSYITMYFHWRGNFVALTLICIVVIIMTIFFIPLRKVPDNKSDKNVALFNFQGYLKVLSCKPLLLMIVYFAFLYSPYWVFLGISSILYVNDLGVPLEQYGYYQGLWALVFAFGSLVGGIILNNKKSNNQMKVSTYISVFGVLILLYISLIDSRDPLVIALSFIPVSLGAIMPTIILYPRCMSFIPELKNQATTILAGSRLLLSAFCLEIVGHYYQGSFKNVGIILSVVLVIAVITMVMVVRNRQIMDQETDKSN